MAAAPGAVHVFASSVVGNLPVTKNVENAVVANAPMSEILLCIRSYSADPQLEVPSVEFRHRTDWISPMSLLREASALPSRTRASGNVWSMTGLSGEAGLSVARFLAELARVELCFRSEGVLAGVGLFFGGAGGCVRIDISSSV
jgi:hypothetical protein